MVARALRLVALLAAPAASAAASAGPIQIEPELQTGKHQKFIKGFWKSNGSISTCFAFENGTDHVPPRDAQEVLRQAAELQGSSGPDTTTAPAVDSPVAGEAEGVPMATPATTPAPVPQHQHGQSLAAFFHQGIECQMAQDEASCADPYCRWDSELKACGPDKEAMVGLVLSEPAATRVRTIVKDDGECVGRSMETCGNATCEWLNGGCAVGELHMLLVIGGFPLLEKGASCRANMACKTGGGCFWDLYEKRCRLDVKEILPELGIDAGSSVAQVLETEMKCRESPLDSCSGSCMLQGAESGDDQIENPNAKAQTCDINPTSLIQTVLSGDGANMEGLPAGALSKLMTTTMECNMRSAQDCQMDGKCEKGWDETCTISARASMETLAGGTVDKLKNSKNAMAGLMEASAACAVKAQQACTDECAWDASKQTCSLNTMMAVEAMLASGKDAGSAGASTSTGDATVSDEEEKRNPMVLLLRRSMSCQVKPFKDCAGECQWDKEHEKCELNPTMVAQAMTGVAGSVGAAAGGLGADVSDPIAHFMSQTMHCQAKKAAECTDRCEWDEASGLCNLSPSAAMSLMAPVSDSSAKQDGSSTRRLPGKPLPETIFLGSVRPDGEIRFLGLQVGHPYTAFCADSNNMFAKESFVVSPPLKHMYLGKSREDTEEETTEEASFFGVVVVAGLALVVAGLGVLYASRSKRTPSWKSSGWRGNESLAESELIVAPSAGSYTAPCPASAGTEWAHLADGSALA